MRDDLLTTQEVAEWLKVAPYTVRRWAKEGVLPFVRVGNKLQRFRREDVEAFLDDPKPAA